MITLVSLEHLRRDDEKPVQAAGVMGQHVLQTRLEEIKAVGGETQIDDARVWLAMAEDELAEIAVVGDQDAALPLRYGKNLLVGKTCGILAADPPGGVTELNKPGDETRVCALVEKEVHTFVGGVAPRSCPTTACA